MTHRTFRQLGPRTYLCLVCAATVVERWATRTEARRQYAYPNIYAIQEES